MIKLEHSYLAWCPILTRFFHSRVSLRVPLQAPLTSSSPALSCSLINLSGGSNRSFMPVISHITDPSIHRIYTFSRISWKTFQQSSINFYSWLMNHTMKSSRWLEKRRSSFILGTEHMLWVGVRTIVEEVYIITDHIGIDEDSIHKVPT